MDFVVISCSHQQLSKSVYLNLDAEVYGLIVILIPDLFTNFQNMAFTYFHV